MLRRSAPGPLLEVPLRRMKLPERIVGGNYYLVELLVGGERLTMLLDTGLTASVLLLEKTLERLGLSAEDKGVSSFGATSTSILKSATLPESSLCDGGGNGVLPLREMGGVVVKDFPQRAFGDEMGTPIDGMLGQGFMALCDLEIDPVEGTMRAWPPGALPQSEPGWQRLPTLSMPGDLKGLLLSVPGCLEPVVGIVDSGASHTVVNLRAAFMLGLELKAALARIDGSIVRGIGLDSTALEMPMVYVDGASLFGAGGVAIQPRPPNRDGLLTWSFGNVAGSPGEQLGPLQPVKLAVGDIAFFEQLLGQGQDSIGDFRGPAALLGQDFLGQLPVRYSSTSDSVWFRAGS